MINNSEEWLKNVSIKQMEIDSNFSSTPLPTISQILSNFLSPLIKQIDTDFVNGKILNKEPKEWQEVARGKKQYHPAPILQ